MHNLSTVIKFEIIRTLKKKTFWLMALGFPVIVALLFLVIFASQKATESAVEKTKNSQYSVLITDSSGYVSPRLIKAVGASQADNKQDAIAKVRSGEVDAYFFYPQNLAEQPVQIYGQDVGLFKNNRYKGMAEMLLNQSVTAQAPAEVAAVLQGNTQFESTTYENDGQINRGIMELIAPGIFLVLFWLAIAMFGNQALTSTTEEKENRIVEMILTTIRPTALIAGKLISLTLLIFLQSAIMLAPIIAGYLILKDRLKLPDFDLSTIPLDWTRIGIAVIIFCLSILLFNGLLVTIGSATPTAKEAGSFMGIVYVLIFGPLYAAPLFVSNPDSLIVQILSYFPLTAPVPLLLRNAVGNLELWQAGIAIAILAVSTILVIGLAVRVFRFGALEYSSRLSFKQLFTSK